MNLKYLLGPFDIEYGKIFSIGQYRNTLLNWAMKLKKLILSAQWDGSFC